MADKKNLVDGRDDTKIDINDASEVEYVHQQFPNMSHQQIVEAIKTKGPSRQAVIDYLSSKAG
ncbi:MAG: hypothetical protein JWR61_3557 [Ferruginibacter sp.]|jgi:hypothetical protein|uniref:DUF3606 domain-containing protein n=1 Tax=Ferruginibacter sp. TaxID=1940288 RepID=UPI00265A79B9|nr:DUF3606 domain-containing protein [Ferruginibacter sp.]MDB5278602.1 hypothetical protein [Ferruginibacter sp.]